MKTFLELLVTVMPLLVVALLLALAGRVGRGRSAAISRQIAVTDAIHRELGALVAPVVRRARGGAWEATIGVPFERPAAVERVVTLARETLARLDPARADRVRIVLVPQARFTRYMPTATKSIASASAFVMGSPRRSAPASMPKIGVQKENAASGAAG